MGNIQLFTVTATYICSLSLISNWQSFGNGNVATPVRLNRNTFRSILCGFDYFINPMCSCGDNRNKIRNLLRHGTEFPQMRTGGRNAANVFDTLRFNRSIDKSGVVYYYDSAEILRLLQYHMQFS